MTNEEAKEYIKANYPDKQRYEGLCEALDMAIEALEKQIPKKPTWTERTDEFHEYIAEAWCPVCGTEVYEGCCCQNNECRQKLDWSEEL